MHVPELKNACHLTTLHMYNTSACNIFILILIPTVVPVYMLMMTVIIVAMRPHPLRPTHPLPMVTHQTQEDNSTNSRGTNMGRVITATDSVSSTYTEALNVTNVILKTSKKQTTRFAGVTLGENLNTLQYIYLSKQG